MFVKGTDIVSEIIEGVDNGPFSHVAVAISESHVIESQYPNGTQINRMNYSNYTIIHFDITDQEAGLVVSEAIELESEHGKYDFIQVVWYLVRKLGYKGKIWNNKKENICSELADNLLVTCGILPKDKDTGNRTPNELYKFALQYGHS